MREYSHVLELNENLFAAWIGLGWQHFLNRDMSEALRCFEKLHSLAPFYPPAIGFLAGILARMGDNHRAEELLGKLGPAETYGVPVALALHHLFKGETEKAAEWWEKVIDQRDPHAPLEPRLPVGDALRSSPRWPALAQRMNLPPEAI